ncbi:PucR family transcriptional regulator [Nocardioides sp.]|uniref:PucR family transcriptional regulator n=1 Tax=Nocardioides sp. TaxID=35761 RepID=UPI002CCA69F1|nr:helix-turn-helix domain-containing protein [Nocardioides sp.]HSX66853.1 helix-turn-helix domain-containing protein [Nocardioides sp.]
MNARSGKQSDAAVDPRVHRIIDTVRSSFDDLVATCVDRTWAQVPAYSASADHDLRDDLRLHIDAVFRAVLATISEGRPARRSDFPITAAQATRRVRQGVSLADFLQAFRLNQVTLWESVLKAAGSDLATRDAALTLAAHVMQVIEVGSTVAAEAYVEAQQLQVAETDRVRRDLLEDLLAGREVAPGAKQAMLRMAGLESSTQLVVASAVPVGDLVGDQSLRDVVYAAGRELGGGYRGFAVVRHDEVIGVSPISAGGAPAVIERLQKAQRRLSRQGISLAMGISTVHTGPSGVAEAYSEASAARDGLGAEPGVLALPLVSSFEYLVLRDDPTARRLIRTEIRRFIEEDQARGGALIQTLLEYVAWDLNAKIAAEKLHMHVNTAYYRLDRIAERTGCDLRKFADVQELVIAIRLLSGQPKRPSQVDG